MMRRRAWGAVLALEVIAEAGWFLIVAAGLVFAPQGIACTRRELGGFDERVGVGGGVVGCVVVGKRKEEVKVVEILKIMSHVYWLLQLHPKGESRELLSMMVNIELELGRWLFSAPCSVNDSERESRYTVVVQLRDVEYQQLSTLKRRYHESSGQDIIWKRM